MILIACTCGPERRRRKRVHYNAIHNVSFPLVIVKYFLLSISLLYHVETIDMANEKSKITCQSGIHEKDNNQDITKDNTSSSVLSDSQMGMWMTSESQEVNHGAMDQSSFVERCVNALESRYAPHDVLPAQDYVTFIAALTGNRISGPFQKLPLQFVQVFYEAACRNGRNCVRGQASIVLRNDSYDDENKNHIFRLCSRIYSLIPSLCASEKLDGKYCMQVLNTKKEEHSSCHITGY